MSDSALSAMEDLPLSQQSESDIAEHVQQCVKDYEESLGKWLEEAEEAYRFVAGDQWSEEDLAILREQQRPAIVFNRIAPLIDSVAGSQVNNRQETKFLPRTLDDNGKAEILQGVVAWVRDNCDAEDEESEAFLDVAICGMGWLETRIDYTDDPDGRIVIERRDPLEMGYDPAAHRRNLADARWRYCKRKMPIDEVLSLWPDAKGALLPGSISSKGNASTAIRPVRDAYDGASAHSDEAVDRGAVEVVHYQWRELETEYLVLNAQMGSIERLSAEEWAKLGEKVGQEARDKLRHVRQAKQVWYKAIVVGTTVLESGPNAIPSDTTFKSITGKRDKARNCFYGIVRMVMDPQRWANKWLSQSLHMLNTSAKSGVIIEESAIAGNLRRKFEEDWAKPGSVSVISDGGMARMQPKQPPQFPSGFDRMLQFAIASIPDVSGINKEVLGLADREQAGVVEWQRKQAAQTVLAPLFDSLRRYYKEEGRLLLKFISAFIPPDKVMRITMPDGKPAEIMPAMIPDAETYDVVVDQAPTSPNQKMEVWGTLQPALPALLKMGLPMQAWAELLRYSPLPESAVEKIVEGITNQPPPPPPPEVMKMKAEMEMKQADMAMRQQQAQEEGQRKTAEMSMQLQMQQQQAQLEMEIEAQKAAQAMQLAREQAAIQMQLKREQAALDAELKASDQHSREVERRQASTPQVGINLGDGLAEKLGGLLEDVQGRHGEHARMMAETVSGLAPVLERLASMVEAGNRPKTVVIERDKDGRKIARQMTH